MLADAPDEWQTGADGKQPYAFARFDGAPLALAGLWEGWRDPVGKIRRKSATMAAAANTTMATIPGRMPVILERGAWPVRLDEDRGDAAAMMRPAADGVLRRWPVSRDVNSPRHDRPDLLGLIELPTVLQAEADSV